jgi:DNA-binding CsgD family transcriptional regulator
MRIGFDETLAHSLDIAPPSGRCIAVTTRPNPPPSDLAQLTDAQRDCLRLVFQHMKSKDIARVLGVSPHTVDMRLRTAMRTLSVGSRIEAARLLMQEEAGGAGADVYQPLIYHTPDVASDANWPNLVSPGSIGSDDSAHHSQSLRFSPDVDPFASGPPRESFASVPSENAHPSSWSGAGVADPGIGARPLAGSLPWGKKNDLAIGARLAWIFFIAVGSALAFGAILAALASLKTLI